MTFDKLIKRINKKIDKCISNGDKFLYLEIKVSASNVSLNDFIFVYERNEHISLFHISEINQAAYDATTKKCTCIDTVFKINFTFK